MATMASAARDIPKASADRDNLTVVAADTRSVPVTSRSLSTHSHTLPTPPNSISPALPPHGLKAQLQKAKLEPIDSDLDLSQDGTGSPTAYDTGSSGGGGEPITPALLAREYLPDILLNNGPLAIRYIMGHLTSAVPGFATIPPAKARRLVVGALEGRTHGNGKDEDGDVVFEKVGWGRWDARKRGQPARQQLSPEAAAGIPISAQGGRARPRLATSIGEDSATFSHDDRGMLDLEADRMSLDESEIASCSEAPSDDDGDIVMGDDPEDVTDDEDWAAVGAAALRAASYNGQQHPEQNQGSGHLKKSTFLSSRVHTSTAGGGSRSFSASIARPPQMPKGAAGAAAPGGFVDIGVAFGRASDAQEREAVEALLRLGSV